MYPIAVRELAKALRPGGRLLLMTSQRKLLQSAALNHQHRVALERVTQVWHWSVKQASVRGETIEQGKTARGGGVRADEGAGSG